MTPNSGEYDKDESLQKITAARQQALATADLFDVCGLLMPCRPDARLRADFRNPALDFHIKHS